MTTVNKYRIWCNTEADYVYSWSETEPTTCPTDPAHSINTSLTTIVDTVETSRVIVEDYTVGYFETSHVVMNIPVGTPGDIEEIDIEWPMDILLWRTILKPTSDMIGDFITVVAGPETTIGVAAATVNVSDTTISVNSTVTDNIWRGFLVTLDDTVNKDVCGRCTDVDKIAGTISFQTATANSFAAGTPVKISIYVLDAIELIDTDSIDIGLKGIKGKTLSKGTKLRIYYTNNSGTSKTLRWRIEYYNNG